MIAKKELDETSTALNIFKNLVKIGCKGAIKVSEKI